MKRLKTAIVFVLMLLVAGAFGQKVNVYADDEVQLITTVGDVDKSGKIDAKDVTQLRRYLAGGWGVTLEAEDADLDQSGKVDAKDVTMLRRFLAGGWGVVLPEKSSINKVYATWDEYVEAGGVDEKIEFPDANLKRIVENGVLSLGKTLKEEGAIWRSDVYEIHSISGIGAGITDLTGLGELVNLTSLNIWSNEISDISELSNLVNLEDLMLQNMSVADISPVMHLGKLSSLSILGDDNLDNIEAIGYLKELKMLWLSGCKKLSDIYPVYNLDKLNVLYIPNTAVETLDGIEKLSNLMALGIDGLPVLDISPIFSLDYLMMLSVDANDEILTQICGQFPYLFKLELIGNNGELDITPLESLSMLSDLTIREAKIVNASVIGKMTGITDLRLNEDELTDISFVSSLENLQTLNISINKVKDITGISNLKNLTSFIASFNEISDISELCELEKLQTIYLNDNRTLTSIAPISDLANLSSLYLSGTSVSLEEIKEFKEKHTYVDVFSDYPSSASAGNEIVQGGISFHYISNETWMNRVAFENDYYAQISIEDKTFGAGGRITGFKAINNYSNETIQARFEYDENGINVRTIWEYSDGTRFLWEYDEKDRLIHAKETDGVPFKIKKTDYGRTSFTQAAWWNWNDEKTTVEYKYSYDDYGNIQKIECQNMSTEEHLTATYEYEDQINTKSVWKYDSGKEYVWQFSKENETYSKKEILEDGTAMYYEFDDGDMCTKITWLDAEDGIISYEEYTYDDNRMRYITKKYTKDSISLPTGKYWEIVSDMDDCYISYKYDEKWRQTKIICDKKDGSSSLAVSIEYTDDAAACYSWVYSDGRERIWKYNENGVLKYRYDNKGNITTYEYDDNGEEIRIIYNNGSKTEYIRDDEGRILATITYNSENQITSSHQNEYAAVSGKTRLIKETFTSDFGFSGSIPLRYYKGDVNGCRSIDFNNYTIEYFYDDIDRCNKIICSDKDSDRTITVSFEYQGEINTIVHLIYSVGDEEYWEYDEQNRLLKEYKCDANGNFIELTENIIINDECRPLTEINKKELIEIMLDNSTRCADPWEWGIKTEKKYMYDSEGYLIKILCTRLDTDENVEAEYEYEEGHNIKSEWTYSDGKKNTWNLLKNNEGEPIGLEFCDSYGNNEKYAFLSSGELVIQNKSITDVDHYYGNIMVQISSGGWTGYNLDYSGYLFDYEYDADTGFMIKTTIKDTESDAVFVAEYEYTGNVMTKAAMRFPEKYVELFGYYEEILEYYSDTTNKSRRNKFRDGTEEIYVYNSDGTSSWYRYDIDGNIIDEKTF